MWTPFPELDEVLAAFVDGVREVLGENLCGIYLQGSFAVGDADEWSDVDFLVVSEHSLGEPERPALDECHGRLFCLPVHWAKHLEGSYIDRALLRVPDPKRSKLVFLDHGSQALVRDDHCNTAFVRWTLREHGITLMGPEPKTLVDPVPPAVLREEARERMPEWGAWACSIEQMSRWHWPYIVISLCRVLWTMEYGTVVSKRAAGEWALGTLDREWAPLIQKALDDRPDPIGRWYQPAAPEDVEQTLAFVRYAASRSRS